MLRYAKIIRFPEAFTENYEYRYRCCEREYRIRFKRLFRGNGHKGAFSKISSVGVDLREREPTQFAAERCVNCGTEIPRPWESPNKDPFLQDTVKDLALRVEALEREER